MRDIINLALLGLLAGGISAFWTRIISEDMIFEDIGKWFRKMDNRHAIITGHWRKRIYSKLLGCVFCLCPWLCLLLYLWYGMTYHPQTFEMIIGMFAGLGCANLVAEIVYSLRKKNNNEDM